MRGLRLPAYEALLTFPRHMNPIGQELTFIMSHFSGCLVTTSSKASAPLGHMLLEGAIVGIGIGDPVPIWAELEQADMHSSMV